MEVKTYKQTTVFISLGEKTKVFSSPEDIPQELRQRLMRSTRSMNSATILIADRGGRREIQKILEGQPSGLDGVLRTKVLDRGASSPSALAESLPHSSPSLAAVPARSSSSAWTRVAELCLPAALGVALWLLFTLK